MRANISAQSSGRTRNESGTYDHERHPADGRSHQVPEVSGSTGSTNIDVRYAGNFLPHWLWGDQRPRQDNKEVRAVPNRSEYQTSRRADIQAIQIRSTTVLESSEVGVCSWRAPTAISVTKSDSSLCRPPDSPHGQ